MHTFDAIRFLDNHFADSTTLRETFARHGVDSPSYEQMRKWRGRRRIPADWLALILYVLEIQQGHIPAIREFITTGGSKCQLLPRDKRKLTGELAKIYD